MTANPSAVHFRLLLLHLLESGGAERALRAYHQPCRRLVDFSDFCQNILLRAWAHQDSFRGQTEAELAGWLQAIGRQEMIELLRRSKRGLISPLPDQIADPRTMHPFERISSQENAAWLADLLSGLDPDDADLLVRRYYHGEHLADIARRKGLSPNTIAQKHLRLIKRIRTLRGGEARKKFF